MGPMPCYRMQLAARYPHASSGSDSTFDTAITWLATRNFVGVAFARGCTMQHVILAAPVDDTRIGNIAMYAVWENVRCHEVFLPPCPQGQSWTASIRWDLEQVTRT